MVGCKVGSSQRSHSKDEAHKACLALSTPHSEVWIGFVAGAAGGRTGGCEHSPLRQGETGESAGVLAPAEDRLSTSPNTSSSSELNLSTAPLRGSRPCAQPAFAWPGGTQQHAASAKSAAACGHVHGWEGRELDTSTLSTKLRISETPARAASLNGRQEATDLEL